MQNLFGEAPIESVRDLSVRRTRDRSMVNALVAEWHSVLPNGLPGFRAAFVAEDANYNPVAVAVWGHPLARAEDQEGTLELARLAHGPRSPRNTGSWMLARMRGVLRQEFPDVARLISYQDCDAHDGALYRADNWQLVYSSKQCGHSWNSRNGRIGTERKRKAKWERALR